MKLIDFRKLFQRELEKAGHPEQRHGWNVILTLRRSRSIKVCSPTYFVRTTIYGFCRLVSARGKRKLLNIWANKDLSPQERLRAIETELNRSYLLPANPPGPPGYGPAWVVMDVGVPPLCEIVLERPLGSIVTPEPTSAQQLAIARLIVQDIATLSAQQSPTPSLKVDP